jgi:uncharacterized protein (UPF0210 family)
MILHSTAESFSVKQKLTRREFSTLAGMALTLPLVGNLSAAYTPLNFRVRAITAGLHLEKVNRLAEARSALAFLQQARNALQEKGYEVQTLRMATQPLGEYLPDWLSESSIGAIKSLDEFAQENNVAFSIGPAIVDDHYHAEFASWCSELIQQTLNISLTCQVASAQHGIHHQTLRCAAEAIHAIAKDTAGGEGNFRFAATAFIPPGTPFFPAAFFNQGNAFSIGLESPNLLTAAFAGATDFQSAQLQLKNQMESAFTPIEETAVELAQSEGWEYLGIDASPAPGLDASIGQAIESLIKAPFGSPSTLAGCAAITDVLKSLSVETCGYSGLMLPVLEDTVLAQRVNEGRYGVSELLLYSNVCGTGLDVVPLPGDTPVEALAAVVLDVASLAAKYSKPLSARLFPCPGKQAGEMVSFDNPHLTEAMVMDLHS